MPLSRPSLSPPSPQLRLPPLRLHELWQHLPPDHRQAILGTLVRLVASQASLAPKEVTYDDA
jgi:hypothetical protein